MQSIVFRPEPAASELVARAISRFLERSTEARELARRMRDGAGARLSDAIEVLGVPESEAQRQKLTAAGFARLATTREPTGHELWEHAGALLPLFELRADQKLAIFVRTDSIVDFLEANVEFALACIEGNTGASIRRARIAESADSELWLVERWVDRRLITSDTGVGSGPGMAAMARHLDAFRLRPRPLADPEKGFEAALTLVRAAQADLGEAIACELFFEAERRFYTLRNRAARLQKARQDLLGLGWYNRDHHTYRSSRACFRSLVGMMEALGLVCRERFYAGADAGWGAQVMEHTELGICVFADVDLSPEEVAGDFAHSGLAPRDTLGTVGLWCELHGEAFLAAGMHHLECQFESDVITAQLNGEGVGVMPRFTDYTYLKQAFTKGEIWRVDKGRLEQAKARGYLSPAQAERIAREGVLGSHFEVLERNDGYKGFNQEGINRIILATDPRHAP
jgi:hypothetical protein